MIELLLLFWTFFKIGLFTFGGGYAMIPMITDEMIKHGWMTENEILSYIAIGESTPGPFAINMATLIGSLQGGPLGAIVATLGVILPPIIIVLLILKLFQSFIKNKYVQGVLKGIKPVIVALIFSTGLLLTLKTIFVSFIDFRDGFSVPSICLLIILAVFSLVYKKTRKKELSPISLICFSALLGIIIFL